MSIDQLRAKSPLQCALLVCISHAEWLGLLLDREVTHRHDKRLGARLRHARLRHQAAPEDVDYRSHRGLDRRLLEALFKGDWIDTHDNLAICGPTGIGKSWLACAIGHKACRDNRSVLYTRFPRLLDGLMPGALGELACDDSGPTSIAILEDLEQVMAGLGPPLLSKHQHR